MGSTIPVFEPASPEAHDIYGLFVQVLVMSILVFGVVSIWIAVAVFRGRKRTDIPVQNFGNKKVEFLWLIGPCVIVLWLGAMSAHLVFTLNAFPPGNEAGQGDVDLIVTGHQWWWEIEYPGQGIVAANEIHIPVGKKLRLSLTSADVIHGFWVPQLARKIDAIPERSNYIWLEAEKPGVYQGRCAEYCGDQHAWMEFKVFAHKEDDYAVWVSAQQAKPDLPADDQEAIAGRDLFMTLTCVKCHAIEGTAAVASIGPNLTHFASRQEIGGGVLANNRDNLLLWLHAPEEFKPGSKMPDFKLSQQHLGQLVAYLGTLK